MRRDRYTKKTPTGKSFSGSVLAMIPGKSKYGRCPPWVHGDKIDDPVLPEYGPR
jgi:hypothetical protein